MGQLLAREGRDLGACPGSIIVSTGMFWDEAPDTSAAR